MAGARLGFGVGCASLIQDLNTIKYSTNPYNINRMTMAAGIGALEDKEYFENNCKYIIRTREYATVELTKLGFEVLPSGTNFVFAKHPNVSGLKIYQDLKGNGILVRHFTKERICEYNRITIGTKEQMDMLLSELEKIVK